MASTSGNPYISIKTHYARLGHACQSLLQKMMQGLLQHYKPKTHELFQDCLKNRYLHATLSNAEMKTLRTASREGYVQFDIPLIYKILRNVTSIQPPTKFWDYPNKPSPNELTIGDDVERIRRIRNEIIHRGHTAVEDKELNDYFTSFKEIAQRLETILKVPVNHFVYRFEDLESCCMDEETEEKYLRELETYQEEISSLQDTVDSLSSQVDENFDVIIPPEDTTCIEGDDTGFECVVVGCKTETKWYKEGQEIQSDNAGIETKNQTIRYFISKATREDTGHYTMEIGDKKFEVYLNVEERKPTLITLRKYQEELANIALKGENTIICSGTNTGKTYVAFHIIEHHLLKNKQGKVAFLSGTNVLLEQQYERACDTFNDLFFQGELYRWRSSEEGECGPFKDRVKGVQILFCTPGSLCKQLDTEEKSEISISDFSLIILDECHHVVGQHPSNQIMKHYRRHKYDTKCNNVPQIVGLTASPGTNKAMNETSAVDHLKNLMITMDVAKLSVVRVNHDELSEYTSTLKKEPILSQRREEDTVQNLLLATIKGIEEMFKMEKIQSFLLEDSDQTRSLLDALKKPPPEKSGMIYTQWVAATKSKIECVMLKDNIVPRILHSCFTHLEIYVDCLEMNTLLEIENVRDIVKDNYGYLSSKGHNSDIQEERLLLKKLKDVFVQLVNKEHAVERNPDVHAIINTLQEEYKKYREDSRFLIFVKTRATAKALSERLPAILKSCYLTGRASSDKCGLNVDEQLAVVEQFRKGEYLTMVATSVAFEGLDIKQCNLAIRYKFRVDEISSFQIRGRIRNKNGKEVVLAAAEDLRSEERNIMRQYYMEKAIDKVMNMDLTMNLAIAGKKLYDDEERERWLTKMKLKGKLKSSFSVHCRRCGKLITDGQFLRHINKRQYIVYDKTVFSMIQCDELKKVESFDAMKKIERASGTYPCRHHWGSILLYKDRRFLALSRDSVNMYKNKNENIPFKKWIDFPYEIASLTDSEVSEY